MDDSRYDTGMRVRRAVLGDAHVDRAEANKTTFDQPFQRFITETAWGTLWASDLLDRPTRSLITIAILAALGRHEELALHLRATANTGATPEQIREALMHVAVYAGVPAANSAITLAKSILIHDEHAPAAARPSEDQP
jgi:4-carboxymuconolactone decarboxylase